MKFLILVFIFSMSSFSQTVKFLEVSKLNLPSVESKKEALMDGRRQVKMPGLYTNHGLEQNNEAKRIIDIVKNDLDSLMAESDAFIAALRELGFELDHSETAGEIAADLINASFYYPFIKDKSSRVFENDEIKIIISRKSSNDKYKTRTKKIEVLLK